MKKAIFLLTFSALAFSSFSQQSNPSTTLTPQDYLKKSKRQKTAAGILAGVGIFSTLLSTVQLKLYGEEEPSNPNSGLFLATGLTAIGGSITLYIASSRNKKKAAGMGFKMERVSAIQQQSFVYHSYPALSLKIAIQ